MVRLLRICIWVFIVPTCPSYQVCKQFRAHTHYQISARLTRSSRPHAALFSATPPLHLRSICSLRRMRAEADKGSKNSGMAAARFAEEGRK
ncbi:hypothetical protein V8C43DRAFT_105644 [Trichoderma afarasin]